jgi:outer membrane protein OmpA-like peptidoglycan-associated protein
VAVIEPSTSIVLNNIFFDFDKAVLKPESFPELNRIVQLMNERPGMTVEVTGHTDATGPAEYNMILSERRAKAVSGYLVKQGIAADRIATLFHGESKPIETNDTREGRAKNRRVEFKIVKL